MISFRAPRSLTRSRLPLVGGATVGLAACSLLYAGAAVQAQVKIPPASAAGVELPREPPTDQVPTVRVNGAVYLDDAAAQRVVQTSQSLKGDPRDVDLLLARGQAYLAVTVVGLQGQHLGDLDRAAADFAEATRLAPKRPEGWRGRAASVDVGVLTGPARVAALTTQRSYLNSALALDPEDAMSLVQRGEAEWELATGERGIITRAKEATPLSPEQKSGLNAALTDADAALVLNSNLADGWILKAESQAELGQASDALDSYLHAMNDDPQAGLVAAMERTAALLAAGDAKDVMLYLNRLIPSLPTPAMAAAYATRARAQMMLHDLPGALADANQAVTRGSQGPRASTFYALRANIKQESHDLTGAVEDDLVAVQLAPENLGAWHDLAFCQLSLNEYAGALESFKHIIVLDPTDNASRLTTALLYAGANDSVNAREQYRLALPGATRAQIERQLADVTANAAANPTNATLQETRVTLKTALDAKP